MARAAHSWYLRNTYVENNLIVPGKIELHGKKLDLGRIRHDFYAVGAETDHIAGIINPPGGRMRPSTMEAGGWTGPPGFRSGPADWARPREWAAPRISRSRTRWAVMCLKGDIHWACVSWASAVAVLNLNR